MGTNLGTMADCASLAGVHAYQAEQSRQQGSQYGLGRGDCSAPDRLVRRQLLCVGAPVAVEGQACTTGQELLRMPWIGRMSTRSWQDVGASGRGCHKLAADI